MKIKFTAILATVALASAMLTGCYTANEMTEYSGVSESVSKSVSESESESAPGSSEIPENSENSAESAIESDAESDSKIFDDYSDDTYVEYYFRTEKQLNQHFEKHGGEFEEEFGYETAEDYERGASDVINDPDALFKTEAEDGDGVYYIEATNEFVILSTDGYIRTYFRPSAGINYFNRQ